MYSSELRSLSRVREYGSNSLIRKSSEWRIRTSKHVDSDDNQHDGDDIPDVLQHTNVDYGAPVQNNTPVQLEQQ